MRNERSNIATGCTSWQQFNRRHLLAGAATAALGSAWLTPVAELLATTKPKRRAKSVIMLWLGGGPSQWETFDPKPNLPAAGSLGAIDSAVKGVQLGSGLPRVAEQMADISIVRSVVSKEGDHERATYNAKTGFRPDPTLIHPALGAVLCHQLQDKVEIPRHISIVPGEWPARGGYLGDQFDAFQVGDPAQRIPDVSLQVSKDRAKRRIDDLFGVVEKEFARGRLQKLDSRTLHEKSILAARRMMSSEQLKAFDVNQAPLKLRQDYGDHQFGRGCLAAVRLIEAGVRCVEVTLGGWDTHANNDELQSARIKVLDAAFAALIKDLRRRELLQDTIVVCGGEFGRTPWYNPAAGRDHWPHGFSICLAGGGIRGGQVYGETSGRVKRKEKPLPHVKQPRNIQDIHATVFELLGINYEQELDTPVGRPMAINQGKPIRELM